MVAVWDVWVSVNVQICGIRLLASASWGYRLVQFHGSQTINISAHEIRVERTIKKKVSRRLLGSPHPNREGIASLLLDKKRKETMF